MKKMVGTGTAEEAAATMEELATLLEINAEISDTFLQVTVFFSTYKLLQGYIVCIRNFRLSIMMLISSVADPFRGNTGPGPAPDPTKNRKNVFNVLLLITQKMIYYYVNIENINSNKKSS